MKNEEYNEREVSIMGMTCYFSYSWGDDISKDVMDEIKNKLRKCQIIELV